MKQKESKDIISGISIKRSWIVPKILWMPWNIEFVGREQVIKYYIYIITSDHSKFKFAT